MNNETRKKLETLRNAMEEYKGKIDDLKSELEGYKDDERTKYDNMSEGLQQGENGQKIDSAANALEEAFDEADNVVNSLDTIIEKINEAVE